jgi:hypothetical protein
MGPRATGGSRRALCRVSPVDTMADTRPVAILPLTLIALHTRDIRIGIATHVILNGVVVAILTRYLLSR